MKTCSGSILAKRFFNSVDLFGHKCSCFFVSSALVLYANFGISQPTQSLNGFVKFLSPTRVQIASDFRALSTNLKNVFVKDAHIARSPRHPLCSQAYSTEQTEQVLF